jgi:hypothetical protein
MNLLVIAGAKLTPLLRNSSFLFAFFYHFLNFEFNLLNNRALKTKVFSQLLASSPPKQHNTTITSTSLAIYQDS